MEFNRNFVHMPIDFQAGICYTDKMPSVTIRTESTAAGNGFLFILALDIRPAVCYNAYHNQ